MVNDTEAEVKHYKLLLTYNLTRNTHHISIGTTDEPLRPFKQRPGPIEDNVVFYTGVFASHSEAQREANEYLKR